MLNFVWASKKPLDDIATLYEANITLNKSASSYFENAYVVLLGLDKVNKKIAVKPISKEEAQLGFIPEEQRHNITVKSSYSRICNKSFLNDVSELMGLKFANNESYKYKAVWDDKDNALIIDLTHKEG